MKHAFIGQLLVTFFAVLIGVPLGILGGTYLAEYGRHRRIGRFISTLSDIMISVPSIVIGTFVLYGVEQLNYFGISTLEFLDIRRFGQEVAYLGFVDFLLQFSMGLGMVVWLLEDEGDADNRLASRVPNQHPSENATASSTKKETQCMVMIPVL